MKKPVIALLYDFDLTLSKKDQQEFTFIPSLGMKPAEFWGQTDQISKKYQMDRILSYLYYMVKASKDKGTPLTKKALNDFGKDVQLLPGVETWFERINAYGESLGYKVEHYVISSGLKEIMEGTSIAKYFKRIYGCSFHYDERGEADFPSQVINYTTKTQYLFRISKGALDIENDDIVNSYVDDDKRAVPYSRMIYLGDGMTDVPCMKLLREKGGYAVALYSKGAKKRAYTLLKEHRVDFASPANYSENCNLDRMIKQVFNKIVINDALQKVYRDQMKEAKKGE